MKNWAKGLLATIIAGVAVYWLTTGLKSHDTRVPPTNPTTASVDYPPQPQPRMSPLERDTNRNDSDYGSFETGSPESCSTSCLTDKNCKAMTYNTQTRICYLKNDTPPPTFFQGVVSAVKEHR